MTENGPPDAPEDWPLSRLLFTAAHLVEHHFAEHLRAVGLTLAGFTVLALLQDGPLSQRELAARARVEEQTIGRTVARLERLGHVLRQRDRNDLRRVIVERSPSGHETLARAIDRDVVGEALAGIPDLDAFRAQLAHVVHRLDTTTHGSPDP